MERVVLDSLYPLQAELDNEIASKHGVSYASTHVKRLLALLVELGEFANETRCFKYWSLQGPSPKERVLDEYADIMHFIISLGIPLGYQSFAYEPVKQADPSAAIMRVYQAASLLCDQYDKAHYEATMQAFLDLLPTFGYTGEEALKAYHLKLEVNHQRQENHY